MSRFVVATVTDGTHIGRGEAVPYARYGETIDGVVAAIREATGTSIPELENWRSMPAGAARPTPSPWNA